MPASQGTMPEGAKRALRMGGTCVLILSLALAALLLVAGPSAFKFGPLAIRVSRWKSVLRVAAIAGVLFCISNDRWLRRAARLGLSLWDGMRRWPIGLRVATVLACIHGAAVVDHWIDLPDAVASCQQPSRQKPSGLFPRGARSPDELASYDAAWSQVPTGSRVLYRGGAEALLLAEIVYPTRIFMLPQERWARVVRDKQFDEGKGLAVDPLFPSAFPAPQAPDDVASFVRTRAMTHEVRLEAGRWIAERIGGAN